MTIQDKAIARDFSLIKRDYDLFKRQNAIRIMDARSLVSPWTEVTGYEGTFGLWALPIGGATYVYLSGIIRPNGGTATFLRNIPAQYRPSRTKGLPTSKIPPTGTDSTIVEVGANGDAIQTYNFSSSETHLFLDSLFWLAQT